MTDVTRRGLLAGLAAAPVLLAHPSPAGAGGVPWQRLDAAVAGPLHLPSSASYASAKQLFDPRYDGRRPAAVVTVASAADVAAVVRFARAHGLRVTARSGGHSYVGASAANGAIVIDLRRLAGVTYDGTARRASVGAGARLYDVHVALAGHGRAIPTGTCPTVGVSGLTAGGGLGVSSRRHGLTSDALVSAQVVLPDGRIVTVDAHHDADVFWALRGGGGGLVGIVTRWTFATHPATAHGSFVLDVPTTHPEQALRGWGAWVAKAPRSQWANAHLTRTSDGLSLRFVGITDAGEQRSAASALLAACGVRATRATYASRSYLETVRFLGGGTTSPRAMFTAGSDVVGAMDAATTGALVSAVRDVPVGCVALVDPLTGAVRGHAVGDTAFPWRRHVATVQWYTSSTSSAARTWVGGAHRRMASVSSGRYLNYVEGSTTLGTYLGPNTGRASSVRRARDPRGTLVTSLG